MTRPQPLQIPAAPEPETPLRISKLTLNAFRAFPHEVTIDFKNKNLLVYGENGSGKSSIFHALKNFFSLDAPHCDNFKNVFNADADNDFKVQVEFNDGQPAIDWTPNQHLSRANLLTPSDPRVTETALRKSALDYRSLLDTNYIHGDNRPNLFDIVVKLILADFPVTVEGGSVKTIGELWRNVESSRPYDYNCSNEPVNEACVAFSTGLRFALDELQPHLNTMLQAMLGNAVTVASFSFSSVYYSDHWFRYKRVFEGKKLFPEVRFGNQTLEKPQTFLNEARLSALALSMYLAGRLACVPEGGENLKLLVLDDVLIGLDHANRMPVLQLIRQHFADWQVVILTHDKVWFDMARRFYENTDDWEWLEIKADGNDGKATPTLKADNVDVITEALSDARNHIGGDIGAAANSARRAFEATIRRFAEKRNLKLQFRTDPKKYTVDNFLDAIDSWADEKQSGIEVKDITANLRAMQTGVLNPQSHADAPNPSTAEVQSAIDEVEKLKAAMTDQ